MRIPTLKPRQYRHYYKYNIKIFRREKRGLHRPHILRLEYAGTGHLSCNRPPSTRNHIAPLLEPPRSRHFPRRHQPSLHLLLLQGRVPAVFRPQHTPYGLDRLDAVISSVKPNTGGQSLYSKKQNASKASHFTAAAQEEWGALDRVNAFAMYGMKRSAGVDKPEAGHAASNMGDHGDLM